MRAAVWLHSTITAPSCLPNARLGVFSRHLGGRRYVFGLHRLEVCDVTTDVIISLLRGLSALNVALF